MCGISGIIDFRGVPVPDSQISGMNELIRHRGPDDEGVFVEGGVGLGSVRLSILDLSPAGHMPMFSADGRYAIVYNGEIYNYLELRAELRSEFEFRSGSDTEVLLWSYIRWGVDCLDRLNGMFAFAIYDRRERKLFAARDRIGIKPFYYYVDDSRFIFASELTPILSVLAASPAANNVAIFDLLLFNRTQHTENTFFDGIKKLQHGHALTIKQNRLSIWRWYDLSKRLGKAFSNPEELKESLKESIQLRLRSDVPVGTCLSGGLDSSAISAIVFDEFGRKDLHTFSVVYGKGKRGDESAFIDEFRGTFPHMHFIRPDADTFLNDMDDFVWSQSEPVADSSIYAGFKVMELAKDFVTVVLTGQGPDEQMAGYHYFFGFYFNELLRGCRWFKLVSELGHYLKNHRSLFGVEAALYLMLPAGLKTLIKSVEKGYYARDFIESHQHASVITSTLYDSKTLHQSLIDHFEHKFEHLLIWGDRQSMWFSLEARFPFLDHRFVERVLSLQNDWLINKGMTKHILREAMHDALPERIRLRKDKVGFATPEDEWFRTARFRELVFDIIRSRRFRERGFIQPDKAEKMYRNHLAQRCNISNEIWKWINLEMWFQMFVDRKVAPGVRKVGAPKAPLAVT